MKTTDPVEEMSRNLSREREITGLSYKQLERAVVRLLGDRDAPTHETIRAYHQGSIRADRINDRLVLALCRVYNRPITEISPFVAERVGVLLSLYDVDIQQSGCFPGFAVPAPRVFYGPTNDRRITLALPGFEYDGPIRRGNAPDGVQLAPRYFAEAA